MPNRVEAVRDYLGSVANRAIGRAAWRKAMQEPSSLDAYYDNRPSWAKAVNKALNHGALPCAILELGYPLTLKSLTRILHPEENKSSKYGPYIESGKMFLALATDLALWTPIIWLTHNLGEATAFKLTTNIAVQIGSDIANTTINRIRHLRPHNSTLAV